MTPSGSMRFPAGFLWGTATSAHQVEGGNVNNDWWAWEQEPGRIARGDRSGDACGWWRDAEGDFEAIASLGQNAHRLSIEWSRLEPEQGRWDDGAFARYRDMLEGLRRRGVRPMVTLQHFTFPLWVSRLGGWSWPGLAAAFGRFARRAAEGLGDLVSLWCTLNEPVGAIVSGYVTGVFPPGGGGVWRARAAMLNSLRAHAEAYRAIHEVQPDARVGFAANLSVFDPARPGSSTDRWAARLEDHVVNQAYLDVLKDGTVRAPLTRGRMPEAAGTLDFLGINYYTRYLVRFDIRRLGSLGIRNGHAPSALMSDAEYGEVYPEGLFRIIERVDRYQWPIYITENGLPDEDDDLRPAFLHAHLREVWRALEAGHDVRGYFHWSLVDNFEWARGWTLRFGLIAMDPQTHARSPRPSASVYAEICRTGALSL